MYHIAVIPGDGIGPEVIAEGIKVLNSVARLEGINYQLHYYPFGGEYFLKTGEYIPQSAMEEIKKCDAIYFGAIGTPDVQPGLLEKNILLKIRFELDQYINLRPVKLYEERFSPLKNKQGQDIDFVIIRENTEGLYSGIGGFFKKNTFDEIAVQEDINTRKGVERCIRFAYEYTRKRNKKNILTLSDKSNVLTYGHNLWQRVFKEIGEAYTDIRTEHLYIDTLCMWLVKKPERFDVIVTCNMFGDIISDLGAAIVGGLGITASANINPEPGGISMFEPVHGSAPELAGKNIANPLAAILAAKLMLEHLGEKKAAEKIEKAVETALTKGYIQTLDATPDMTTSQIGDLIANIVVK